MNEQMNELQTPAFPVSFAIKMHICDQGYSNQIYTWDSFTLM